MPTTVSIGALTISLYDFFIIMSYVALLLFYAWYSVKYKIGIGKGLIIAVILFIWIIIFIHIQAYVENGFKNWGDNNIIRCWPYVPLMVIPLAKWFKVDYNRLLDYVAPGGMVVHCVSHIGCIFAGCCFGFPYDGNIKIWNNPLADYLFPIQLIESGVACLIVFTLVIVSACGKFAVTGRKYPFFMVLHGITRFICEFFRNNNKIWLGCSSLSFHALFTAVMGILWLFFTTPHGYVIWIKIVNAFRKMIKKSPLTVPTVDEVKQNIITKKQKSLELEAKK